MCTMHLLRIAIVYSEFLWGAIRCKDGEVSSGILVCFNCLKQRFEISSTKPLKQERNVLLFMFSPCNKKWYAFRRHFWRIVFNQKNSLVKRIVFNANLYMMNACSETIHEILIDSCLLDGCVSGLPPETQ